MRTSLKPTQLFAAACLAAGVLASGCQGNRAEAPPVHIWHNMDFQNKLDPQEEYDFFFAIDCPEEAAKIAELKAKAVAHGHNPDHLPLPEKTCRGRAMRNAPAGTVARGHLKNDDHLYKGRGPDGRLVDELPKGIVLSEELLNRGEERYNIYCQPCHDYAGTGQGIATRRGGGFAVQPANFHEDKFRAMPLGHFYDVIVNGKGTMLPYAAQIVSVEDRWAIAAWVRTLQQSRTTVAMGGK